MDTQTDSGFNPVHFSSETDNWATPLDFFKRLDAEFHFEFDVCASAANAKCASFFTQEQDGLQQFWCGTIWMNPPYGRTIGAWVAKAYDAAVSNGATVVCLLPARTDTKWWHEYCMKGEIYFVPGRLKLGDATSGAPFPSAVVVFRPQVARALANLRS